MAFWKKTSTETTTTYTPVNEPEFEIPTPDPEWIWVEGYKGTDENMCCKDYQYELNKHHTFEGEVDLCHAGFHFCATLYEVFHYYQWNFTNRYFKVKALVQREFWVHRGWGGYKKFVAKEIIFLEELDKKEIFISRFSNQYEWITADDIEHFHSNEEYDSFVDGQIRNMLEGKYSSTFLTVMKVYERKDKALVNKMVALYEEGVSPDMRAYLLKDYMV